MNSLPTGSGSRLSMHFGLLLASYVHTGVQRSQNCSNRDDEIPLLAFPAMYGSLGTQVFRDSHESVEISA